MKALITGVHGFIASALKKHLEKQEYYVIGTTKDDSKQIYDILKRETPDIIYHVGAEIYDPQQMFDSNVLQTFHILEYTKCNPKCRLVIVGSSSEYGRHKFPMSETTTLLPETIYEGTKAAASMLARSYAYTYGIKITIIRPFTVYGPNEKPRKFLQILLKKPSHINVTQGVHDFIYIDDFIRMMNEVVRKQEDIFDIVNIGSGIQTSNIDVVRIVEKVTGHKFDITDNLPGKIFDSSTWVCDTSYAQKKYNVISQISLEEGVRLMVTKNNETNS